MSISIVVAKVVRSNEQYQYKVVGKGEKYLVAHADNENAGDKVVEYLKPFAKEIRVESISLQNNSEALCGVEGESIYKGVVRYTSETEEGKMKRSTHKFFVGGKTFEEANLLLSSFLDSNAQDAEILSLTKTNIIEFLER